MHERQAGEWPQQERCQLLPPSSLFSLRSSFPPLTPASLAQSLGTFVFAFVSQHTSHGVYRSLKDRSLSKWKTVSSVSMIIAYTTTVLVASISYFTFWDQTSSDLFTIYPQGKVVDAAKILLSVTMLLTFPMPFFTCRELFLVYWDMLGEEGGEYVEVGGTEDNEEPLLAGMEGGEVGRFNIVHFLSSDEHNAAAGGGDLQLQVRRSKRGGERSEEGRRVAMKDSGEGQMTGSSKRPARRNDRLSPPSLFVHTV